MGDSPFITPGAPARFKNESGESQIMRIGPSLQKSDDGGVTWGPLGITNWFEQRAAQAFANVPQLTAYRDYPIAALPMGVGTAAAATDDAFMESGAVASQAGVGQIFSKSICQLPKTGIYRVDFDGRLVLGAVACEFGIGNAGLTHFVAIALANPTLTWIVRTDAANTSTTAFGDANEHNFGIQADGTTVNFFVDDALIGSIAQSGLNSDEPYYPFMISTAAANSTALKQIGYGFV